MEVIKDGNPIYGYLPRHVVEAEKWAKKILDKEQKANREIVLLSIWLHDIGQAFVKFEKDDEDHAAKSETEARIFLPSLGFDEAAVGKVAHCVRAHRCRDIQPETLEARIVAAADSASHMTDICYLDMASRGNKDPALDKLERDYRDAGLFPELQKEITPIYNAWKELLKAYPD